MIIEHMLYMTAVTLLLALGAHAIGHALALIGSPRRWLWASCMVLSLAGPAVMAYSNHRPAVAVAAVTVSMVTRPMVQAPRVPSVGLPAYLLRIPQPSRSTNWHALERYAKWSWEFASAVFIGLYCLGALRLATARRKWGRQWIGQYRVFVAEGVGPAVFGWLRPAIVVPRWLLAQHKEMRDAALAHEFQHVAARDPTLLFGALLLVALTPWNLPLWWQLRRLRLAIELDCDARVVGGGVDRQLYANTLLSMNLLGGRRQLATLAIVGRVSQVERRIRAMMINRPRQLRLSMALWAAISVPLLVGAAELTPPQSMGGVTPVDSPWEAAAHLPQQIWERLKTADGASEQEMFQRNSQLLRPGTADAWGSATQQQLRQFFATKPMAAGMQIAVACREIQCQVQVTAPFPTQRGEAPSELLLDDLGRQPWFRNELVSTVGQAGSENGNAYHLQYFDRKGAKSPWPIAISSRELAAARAKSLVPSGHNDFFQVMFDQYHHSPATSRMLTALV
ncbi:MAG TPA: M56 family metallopeptidase, partial [Steroidobacteraceae bacterium]|nr:M56 family metallopeptidase [Steroidobacteraceae bacterium]